MEDEVYNEDGNNPDYIGGKGWSIITEVHALIVVLEKGHGPGARILIEH